MRESLNEKREGAYHPITIAIRDLERIFRNLGFSVATGPEKESEWYNFDALNIPPNHPARDLWDTFWIDKNAGELLRTHTSPVQIRYMEKHSPAGGPIAIIAPGKTYRYEATDATHEAQFYQIEGLLVGKDIHLGHLKGVLSKFLGDFYGTKADVRLRPSFFPFVEPGVEVDMTCFNCKKGEECSVCKGTGWIELMGAGMVHPKVLSNVGIDPKVFQGFAFGAGIDRLVMLKYGIDDVRLFYGGDLRLTEQFRAKSNL